MKPNKDRTYFTTLKAWAVVSIILLLVLATALIMATRMPQGTFNGTTTTRTMLAEPCTMDGMENCEAVRVYEDGELVEFYVHEKQ